MALQYQARCQCGYEVDGLADGVSSQGVNWAIAQCLSCQQVVSISDGGEHHSPLDEHGLFNCPCCSSADIYLMTDFGSTLACPQCKKKSIKVHLAVESA